MTTTGDPLNHAVVTALIPFVTPGPAVTTASPGPGGGPGGAPPRNPGRLPVPHVKRPHRRVRLDRAVVEREHVPAGQGEHRAHARAARGGPRVRTAVPGWFLLLLRH